MYIHIICILVIVLLIILNLRCNICENFNQKTWLQKLSHKERSDFVKGQKIMTRMFKEFDRICRKYNLKYWCIGGTFIGAVRHNGWVPWDGDIDVGMLESDYMKLTKIIQNELPNNMWFQSSNTDQYFKRPKGNTDYLPSKIRYLNGYYSNCQDGKQWHNGLQLDIFIFKKIGNKIIGPKENYSIQNNSVTSLDYNDVFPLQQLIFEGFPVYVIRKYKKYCIHYFGTFPPKYPPLSKQVCHEGKISFHIPLWMRIKYPNLY